MGHAPINHDVLSFLYTVEFYLLKFYLEFYIHVPEGQFSVFSPLSLSLVLESEEWWSHRINWGVFIPLQFSARLYENQYYFFLKMFFKYIYFSVNRICL